ncbi:MAG: phosphoribosylformimino-5-aminoimidazole carboxamide ribotide isomerase [Desulfobacter postgatei]|uniref:phosphoribosylformimino-5-aminoimidazole carboxamide ribotide isomerase n=1 Tax=Desulfobacter postgatei TaxID=2293 RepID=UPI0023F36A1A|nr:phosphoribosylformimino-5-aminoimidazole carboxamide ribotide isomerase [Desulfobacter postgatei]MDD4272090.1 phosphoribosylformimino-5-aminoimidazole carboxamide ribotide isomerase [Desulfobacter postgatei]
MKFRPCIDLRNGKVVQIVGSTLSDQTQESLVTNFESALTPAQFARMYRADQLFGGHVIALGPGNTNAALDALQAFPGGLQMGGGINPENAHIFLDAGASHVIVTSYVFSKGRMDMDKLNALVNTVGKNRLVLDLSCRKRDGQFWIVTDRWQKFTEMAVTPATIKHLSAFCDEFLIHGVDVEGKMQGIQEELVTLLGEHSPIPATYAGGAGRFSDLDRVKSLGKGRVDLTIGSALDIFGGTIPYQEVVAWHKAQI